MGQQIRIRGQAVVAQVLQEQGALLHEDRREGQKRRDDEERSECGEEAR